MMLTFLLPLAAEASISLYTGPRPEETATFQDWVTGCDNERNCSAVALEAALATADGRTDHLEIMIEQPLAKHKGPTISLKLPFSVAPQPDLRLFVDQYEMKIPVSVERRVKIEGEAARRLIQRLRKGKWASVIDAEGKAVALASLLGLTASFLRIDEQQGKLGTPEALARPGKRLGYDDLPGYSISLTRPSGESWRSKTEPNTAKLTDNRDQCGAEPPEENVKPSFYRLDDEHTMAIVPWACGNGAYVRYSNIMIVNDRGEVSPAAFDYDSGITGDGPGPGNVQAEVTWLPNERVLESATRFRAIGDCGRTDRYIWDGSKFRLSEQLVMPHCRGSFDRITVWKVDVADR